MGFLSGRYAGFLEAKPDEGHDESMPSVESSNAPSKKRQSKKAKAAAVVPAAAAKAPPSVVKKGPDTINLSNTLKILSEIRSLTVDAIADQPHSSKSQTGDDEDCTVAPTPLDVLTQLGKFDDLIRFGHFYFYYYYVPHKIKL